MGGFVTGNGVVGGGGIVPGTVGVAGTKESGTGPGGFIPGVGAGTTVGRLSAAWRSRAH